MQAVAVMGGGRLPGAAALVDVHLVCVYMCIYIYTHNYYLQ